MSRTIVLEWDPQRALVATGTVARGGKPTLQRAVGFDLPVRDESDEPMTLGESLAEGLVAQRIGKGDVTVIVERSAAEMRVIEVPPVPTEELPQIVRFQAGREFSNLTDDWLLDFVPLPMLANGQHRVLAAAISPQVAAQIRGCCEKAGLHLKRVMLRPFAVARLLKRAGRLFGNLLVVERLAQTVELTVFGDQQVLLARSFRVASEASVEAVTTQVIGEVKRTLGSFRNQNKDGSVNRAIVMVDEPLRESLSVKLRETIGGEVLVDAADPWELFGEAGGSASAVPGDTHQFAAVLGAFDDPTPDPANEIDFLNPTRPPAAPSNRRRNVLIAAAVAALFVTVGALYWMESTRLESKITALQRETKEMRAEDKKYQDRMAEVALLEDWAANRLVWTEELAHLSRRLPLPDDVIVDNLTFAIDEKAHTGILGMRGRAASPALIRRIEQELHDVAGGREISGKNNTPTNTEPYQFIFDETLRVDLIKLKEIRELAAAASLSGQPDESMDGGIEPLVDNSETSAADSTEAAIDERAGDAVDEPFDVNGELTTDETPADDDDVEEIDEDTVPGSLDDVDESTSEMPESDKQANDEPTSDEPAVETNGAGAAPESEGGR